MSLKADYAATNCGLDPGYRGGTSNGADAVNEELYWLYEEDQAERHALDASGSQALLAAGMVPVAADYYHLAMLFQHGETRADYKRAHEYALAAVERGQPHARWLVAATHDRWLVTQGKPQKYGTQFVMKEGRWQLYDLDPTTTDTERAAWGVPPVAETERMMNSDNGPSPITGGADESP